MDGRKPKLRIGAVLPLPAAMVLGVLFFMPWVTLSCDTQAALQAGEMPVLTPEQRQELERNSKLIQASGWQLARGEVTETSDAPIQQNGFEQQGELPSSRVWAYTGLGLPVLLLLISAMRLSGGMPPGKAGGWMIVVGLAGIVLTLVVFSVNYVDDVTSKFESAETADLGHMTMRSRNQLQLASRQVENQLNDILKTDTTPFLWVSLGLYMLVAGCGLSGANGPEALPLETASRTADARPGGPPARRDGPSLPDFGPTIA